MIGNLVWCLHYSWAIRGIIRVPWWWILFWAGCFTQSVTVELSVDDSTSSAAIWNQIHLSTSKSTLDQQNEKRWKMSGGSISTHQTNQTAHLFLITVKNHLKYFIQLACSSYSSSCVISLSGLANCSCSEAYACFDICTLCSSLTRCITKNYDDVQHKMTNQQIDTVGWSNEASIFSSDGVMNK